MRLSEGTRGEGWSICYWYRVVRRKLTKKEHLSDRRPKFVSQKCVNMWPVPISFSAFLFTIILFYLFFFYGGRGTPRPGPRTDCELSRLLATFPLPLSVKTLPFYNHFKKKSLKHEPFVFHVYHQCFSSTLSVCFTSVVIFAQEDFFFIEV